MKKIFYFFSLIFLVNSFINAQQPYVINKTNFADNLSGDCTILILGVKNGKLYL